MGGWEGSGRGWAGVGPRAACGTQHPSRPSCPPCSYAGSVRPISYLVCSHRLLTQPPVLPLCSYEMLLPQLDNMVDAVVAAPPSHSKNQVCQTVVR